MALENLMRKACKWLFLRLKDDMTMRKAYRLDNLLTEMQGIRDYRNIYVEISLEHELGNIKLICEKEYLTEEEERKNQEVREENKLIEEENAGIDKENKEKNEKKPKKEKKKIPFRRGDKPYNLVGLVDDGYEHPRDITEKNINARLYHYFSNLRRFYEMFPDETKPVLLTINVIAEKKEDFDKYTEKTKVYYLDSPTLIIPFLLEFGKYRDHADKAKKDSQMLELGLGKGLEKKDSKDPNERKQEN